MGEQWQSWQHWLVPWYNWRASQISDAEARLRYLNWRASRISDPALRLRYLRRAMEVPTIPPAARRICRPQWVVLGLLVSGVAFMSGDDPSTVEARKIELRPPAVVGNPLDRQLQEIWLVERKDDYEVYSNGLRIETGSATANEPRRPLIIVSQGRTVVAGQSQPAGIVYHTTESQMAPFESGHNKRLQILGHALLGYLRSRHSYHYLIDRFGRVHRVVNEADAAWHAGASVWDDDAKIYLNLNHSFLGVAFELETRPGDQTPNTVTPAQVHAAKTLTALLRNRYRIRASNCVTHAQVSVNPDSFRIGKHTDWAASFPFAEVGLPDNYLRPPACIYEFGFWYDQDYLDSTGGRMWHGLALAQERARQQATAGGLAISGWQRLMQKRFRDLTAAIRTADGSEGKETVQ